MSSASKNVTSSQSVWPVLRQQFHRGGFWLLASVVLVMLTATSVIWNSYQTRMARAQFEALEKTRDELDNEFRSLKLAQAALTEHSRVESIAREKLNMERVNVDSERVVQP